MKTEVATFESVWAAIQESNRILTEKQAETDRVLTKLAKSIQDLNANVGGISNSNGDFAEACFFNSFENGKRNFFGEKFDEIEKNLKGIEPGYKAEYDIVLFNGKSIAIIEVKYKGRKDHVPKLIQKAESFRVNYPKYAHHQIYLALAAMAFDPETEQECADAGVAIIRQVGDTVVICDAHLKVF